MASARTTALRSIVGLLFVGLVFTALSVPALGQSEGPQPQEPDIEPEFTVRILVPGADVIYELQDAEFDLAGNAQRVPAGIEVDAVVTQNQLDMLDDFGVVLADGAATAGAPAPRLAAPSITAEETDTVTVGRVDWFTTKGQGFLSVEAKSSEFQSATLTVSWDGGSTTMPPYVDSGEYLYHRVQVAVDDPRPDTVTVTSSLGGSDEGEVADWLHPAEADVHRPGYEYGFVDGYKNPTEVYDRIDALAAEYPDLAEIVDLPYATNGYRRLAQVMFGTSSSNRVIVDSLAWGHEGGNDIVVELADPGASDSPLSVTVDGNNIVVSLATGPDGSTVSTAAEVAAALVAEAGSLVNSYTYRGNDGNGVVPATEATQLSDFLDAPPEISREPWETRAIRIGVNRDGSKPGVLILAQDHAREWVTPLVAVETAERLLANSDNDPETRRLLRSVDIFIVPSNNPDGAHYSFFDRSAQRRNMTNHCETTGRTDPNSINAWGVDLNRNYSVGSVFDGYTGGSFSCTSDTYAGPEEISEPEAKNVVWFAETFDHIKFFMTVHSSGGQLFWQPGSYIADGRVTTPRPPLADEMYYWDMAEEILSDVKGLRDSVVQPRNVGGSADVLYSSAGNVREELYNNYGIYAFGWEIGGDQWDPDLGRFVSGGGFMPAWPEADQQYQEYASGVIAMFEIAAEYGRDRDPARTDVIQDRQPDGTTNVTFYYSEPATIYYTTDGSVPTTSSPVYSASNMREPGEVILVEENTRFRWFSVDVKGHVESTRTVLVRARPTGN